MTTLVDYNCKVYTWLSNIELNSLLADMAYTAAKDNENANILFVNATKKDKSFTFDNGSKISFKRFVENNVRDIRCQIYDIIVLCGDSKYLKNMKLESIGRLRGKALKKPLLITEY